MSQLLRKSNQYKLFIYAENNHLRVELSGNIPPRDIEGLWSEIFCECRNSGCREILVISDLMPNETIRAFNTSHTLQILQSHPPCQIAWVEQNTISLQVMNFIKDLIDRETHQQIKFFNDLKLARHWLFGKLYQGISAIDG